MADFSVRYRSGRRRRVFHPSFGRRSPQVEDTNQVFNPFAGRAVAIRPPRTALRRMDTKGTGTVSYF